MMILKGNPSIHHPLLLPTPQILGALDDEEADVEDTPDNAGRDLACSRRQAWADVSLRHALDAARTIETVQKAVAEATASHAGAWRTGRGEDHFVMARLLADDARARAAKAAANPGRPLDAYAVLSDDEDQQVRPRQVADQQSGMPTGAAGALLPQHPLGGHYPAGGLGAARAAAAGTGGLGNALGAPAPGVGLPLQGLPAGGVAGGVKHEPASAVAAGAGAGAAGPAHAPGQVKTEGGAAGVPGASLGLQMGHATPGQAAGVAFGVAAGGGLGAQQQQQQAQQLAGAGALGELKQESKADVKPPLTLAQQPPQQLLQQAQQPQQASNALGAFGGLGDFNAFVVSWSSVVTPAAAGGAYG